MKYVLLKNDAVIGVVTPPKGIEKIGLPTHKLLDILFAEYQGANKGNTITNLDNGFVDFLKTLGWKDDKGEVEPHFYSMPATR